MSELILLDYAAPNSRRRPRVGAGGPPAADRRVESGRARPELRALPRPAAGDSTAGAGGGARRAARAGAAAPGATCPGGRLVLLHGKKTIVVR